MKLFLVVVIISAAHYLMCSANQHQCAESSNQLIQGRAFPGFGFNDTEAATNTTTPHVYGCRHLCKYDPGCVALNFLESQAARPNCFLLNWDLGSPALSRQTASLVIIFDQVNCTRSYGHSKGDGMRTDGQANKFIITDIVIEKEMVLRSWTLVIESYEPGTVYLLQEKTSGEYEVIYRQDYAPLQAGTHTIQSREEFMIPTGAHVGIGFTGQGSIVYEGYIAAVCKVAFGRGNTPVGGLMGNSDFAAATYKRKYYVQVTGDYYQRSSCG